MPRELKNDVETKYIAIKKRSNAIKKRSEWDIFICGIKSKRRISFDGPKNKIYGQLEWMEILESS